MAALNFPASPTLNDEYNANGATWRWNGTAWVRLGDPGAQGAQGSTGATGAQGAQGTAGAQGAVGAQGAQGSTGATGAQGSTGATGAQGSVGAQGTAGAQGATGATGAQGAVGATGAQGAAGASGSQGTIGAQGATGAQGAVGATGAQGAQGVQGSPGTLTLNEKSSNYTLVASDNSKIISITAAISITVPSGVFSAGDTVTIVNNTNATRSIVQGSGVTMYTAGTSTTGNKSLIQRGIATVICVSSDTFFISGAGLV